MKLLVVGLGKVGLPLAVYLQSLGHQVAGYDSDSELMERLRSGRSPTPWDVPHVPLALELPDSLRKAVMGRDAVLICVPTPVKKTSLQAYLSSHIVEEAISELSAWWAGLVVVNSTLDPRNVGQVCSSRNVVYNPPLIRLGHVVEDLATAPLRLIGGTDQDTMEEVNAIWERGQAEVVFGDPATIAAAKLAINASLSARVAWANDLALACKRIGVDATTVAAIVGTDPRIGSAYMTPGPPPAGPCLPRDMDVWSSIAGLGTLASRVSLQHRNGLEDALREVETTVALHTPRYRPPKVGIFGLAYTPGGLDATDSFGMAVYRRCLDRGWTPLVNDPSHAYLWRGSDITFYGSGYVIDEADIIVVATEWPEYESLDFKDKLVLRADWRNTMVMNPPKPIPEEPPDETSATEPEAAEPEPTTPGDTSEEETSVNDPSDDGENTEAERPQEDGGAEDSESAQASDGDGAEESSTAVSPHPYSVGTTREAG